MIAGFHKFPHTPHLLWLGAGTPRDDKILTPAQASEFLSGEVIVEEKIEGREVTVGILDGKALPVVEVRTKQGLYDYHNKYTVGASEYLCPAPFEQAVTAHIQAVGMAAYHAIGGRDYARVDMFEDDFMQPAQPTKVSAQNGVGCGNFTATDKSSIFSTVTSL